MIVWGTKIVRNSLGYGTFHCPQCRRRTEYQHVQAQRHGHVYWIPLFRMGEAHQYVECASCGGTFIPDVLRHQPMDEKEFAAQISLCALVSTAMVALADGDLNDLEIAAIGRAVAAISGVDVAADDVARMIGGDLDTTVSGVQRLLDHVEPSLTARGKEALVRAVVATARADGPVDEAESDAILAVAAALGVTRAHLSGILDDRGLVA
jgi:uncharacterized tellurite resistance protein B-like protein